MTQAFFTLKPSLSTCYRGSVNLQQRKCKGSEIKIIRLFCLLLSACLQPQQEHNISQPRDTLNPEESAIELSGRAAAVSHVENFHAQKTKKSCRPGS